MEKIPPKERFNQNEKSATVPRAHLDEAVTQVGMSPQKASLRQLSGGFMNANFLAEEGGNRVVLRIYSTDSYIAKKEFDLLQFLVSHPVLTPKVFSCFQAGDRSVVAMEYIDGITLEDLILSSEPLSHEVFTDVGRALGRIHNIHFDQAGFIGPGLELSPSFDNFSRFIGEFVLKTLKDLENCPEKLSLETNARFRKLVEDKWELVVQTETRPQLAHCDFNPKNILVSKTQPTKVAAVIDWEFSDSGNGLIDLGNFFRFAYDYPPEARDRFLEGYREVNRDLHPLWEDASRLIDLGNMCGFLERKEDYQKTFRTARAVIESTLQYFGY
jgi:aminoglycoside phosphotransferase (APT) family kinase protein